MMAGQGGCACDDPGGCGWVAVGLAAMVGLQAKWGRCVGRVSGGILDLCATAFIFRSSTTYSSIRCHCY